MFFSNFQVCIMIRSSLDLCFCGKVSRFKEKCSASATASPSYFRQPLIVKQLTKVPEFRVQFRFSGSICPLGASRITLPSTRTTGLDLESIIKTIIILNGATVPTLNFKVTKKPFKLHQSLIIMDFIDAGR